MTTNYYDAALTHTGGEELEALRHLVAEAKAIPVQPAFEGFVSTWAAKRLLDAMKSGEGYPANFAEEIRQRIIGPQVVQIQNEARTGIIQEASDRVRGVIAAQTEPMLAWLNDQLGELLAVVTRAAATLGAIRTAAAASKGTAAQLEAWNALTGAVADYRDLRSAQVRLCRVALDSVSVEQTVCAAGLTRDWPDLHYLRATTRYDAGEEMVFESWPGDNGDDRDVLPSTTPELYLIWLAQRGDAWVPGSRSLRRRNALRLRCITTGTRVEEIKPELPTGRQPTQYVTTEPALPVVTPRRPPAAMRGRDA